MRIVLDTNILLVSIPRKSKYRPIFDALLEGKFSLLLSNDILAEYEEIIERKTNSAVASNIVKLLLSCPNVEMNSIYYKWGLMHSDEEDNKFVDCAVACNADFIVSSDKHFQVLKEVEFPSVIVISIKEFLRKLHTS